MGIGDDFGSAFAKAQLAAGNHLPLFGRAFLSLKDADKPFIIESAQKLVQLGFQLVATRGTASYLTSKAIPVQTINKVAEGSPHVVEELAKGKISLVINTVQGRRSALDSFSIRRTTLMKNIPYFTTVAAARAAVDAIGSLRQRGISVKPIQDYYWGQQKQLELRGKAL